MFVIVVGFLELDKSMSFFNYLVNVQSILKSELGQSFMDHLERVISSELSGLIFVCISELIVKTLRQVYVFKLLKLVSKFCDFAVSWKSPKVLDSVFILIVEQRQWSFVYGSFVLIKV